MATIIDSLLVTLGLDSSNFKSGRSDVKKSLEELRSEADKTAKALDIAKKAGAAKEEIKKLSEAAKAAAKELKNAEAAAKANSKSLNETASSAMKFLAIVGGAVAIKQFIGHVIESSSALDRLSQNLHENVETISAWSNAAELAGGDANGLQGTFDMLSKAQTELQLTGQSNLIPYFSALGLSMADAEGKARPVNDLLLDMADRFSRLDRPTANNMGRMMGIDQGTLNLILKGRAEVELMLKRQKEYGAVTKEQAEASSKLREQLVRGRQTFEAFGRELLMMVMPALEKLLDMFSGLGDWMRENKEFIQIFLAMIAAGLAAIVLATTPINLTIAAVTALAAAIALLYQDYLTWKRGGDSLIDWGKWEPGIKAAGAAIRWFKDLLADLIYRAIAAADVFSAIWDRDWKRLKFAAGEFISGNGKEYGKEEPEQKPTAGTATAAPTASTDMSLPRGVRNNNPGNLNFAGQAGASKEAGPNGRFAVFGSMQEGVAALVKQIGLYVGRGKNTIRKIIETYAPSNENDTGAYINAVSKSVGIAPDAPLDPNNANQIIALVKAITTHENGAGFVSDKDIAGGYQMAMGGGGIPGASMAAMGAGAGNVAKSSPAAPTQAAEGSKSVETNIGEVKIYTAATDANGIAKDMGKSLDYLFASQANYGLM